MVLSLAKFREKLNNKIFNTLGTSASLETVASSSSDKYDVTWTYNTSTALTVVPFDMVGTEDFQPFGELKADELDMVIPITASFGIRDKITYDGTEYIVKEITRYPYQGDDLAYAVRLARNL